MCIGAVCATEEVFTQLLAHYLHALDCGRILHALRKLHHLNASKDPCTCIHSDTDKLSYLVGNSRSPRRMQRDSGGVARSRQLSLRFCGRPCASLLSSFSLLSVVRVQITHRKALKMSRVSEEWQNKKQKPLLASCPLSFLDAISGAVADVGTDHGRS